MSCPSIYAEHGFGMYLNEKEAYAFANAYLSDPGDDADSEYAPDFDELADELQNELEAVSVLSWDNTLTNGEIRYLDGKHEGGEPETGIIVYGKKGGSAIADPEGKRTYASLSEMSASFRTKYSKYLPKDFDYEAHMVEFLGAFYIVGLGGRSNEFIGFS